MKERMQQLGSPGLLAKIEQARQERQARRDALRARHPDITCLECMDTGEVSMAGVPEPCLWCERGQRLRAQHERARRDRWRLSVDGAVGIPPLYRKYSFEFCDLPRNEPPVSTIKEWASGNARRWLYLFGAFGRGKSALAAVALREQIWRNAERDGYERTPGAYGQFLTVAGMLQSLRPQSSTDLSPQQRIERYQRVPCLVLDDIGAERLTAWGAEQVFEVLNERCIYLRLTILTSNYSLPQLEQKINQERELSGALMGARIVERIKEASDVLAFPESLLNWRSR